MVARSKVQMDQEADRKSKLLKVAKENFKVNLRKVTNVLPQANEIEPSEQGVKIDWEASKPELVFEKFTKKTENKKGSKFKRIPRGIAKINNPIIRVPDDIVIALNAGFASSLAREAVKQDCAFVHEFHRERGPKYVHYDPSPFMNILFSDRRGDEYSDALCKSSHRMVDKETSIASLLLRRNIPDRKTIPANCLVDMRFLETIRAKNYELLCKNRPGWNKANDIWYDGFNPWVMRLELAGKLIVFIRGKRIGAVLFNGVVHIGATEIIDHIYTLASISLNWKIIESSAEPEVGRFLASLRRQVMTKYDYQRTFELMTAFETFCHALVDLHDNCGPRFVQHAFSEMSDPLSSTPKKLVTLCKQRPLAGCHWVTLLARMHPKNIMRVSQVHKAGFFAITSVEQGLSKQADRVTRKFDTDRTYIQRLVAFSSMTVAEEYCKKHQKRALPPLRDKNGNHTSRGDMLETEFSTLGYTKFWQKYKHPVLWNGVFPWAIENFEFDTPMSDSIRDKRMHLPKVNFSGISKEDEIHHFLTERNDNKSVDFRNLLEDLSDRGGEQQLDEFEYHVDWHDFGPRTRELIESHTGFYAEGNPKEKEMKVEARFFVTGQFILKKEVSQLNEACKLFLKYCPGSIMSLSDEQRRVRLELIGRSTSPLFLDKRVKGLIDISGHNQSFTPEISTPFFELIGAVLGTPEIAHAPTLFNRLFFHYAHPFHDMHYSHVGQLGGIEGWFGYAWGAHSAMTTELMMFDRGMKGSSASYGDDVVIDIQDSQAISYSYLEKMSVEAFGRGGQQVKAKQTAWTRARSTLLRQTYASGFPASLDLKKMVSACQVTDSSLMSDLSAADNISSASLSSLSDSEDPVPLLTVKWVHVVSILIGGAYAQLRHYGDENHSEPVRTCWRTIQRLVTSDPCNMLEESGQQEMQVGHIQLFFHYDLDTGVRQVMAKNTDTDKLMTLSMLTGEHDYNGYKRSLLLASFTPDDLFTLSVLPSKTGGLHTPLWVSSVVLGLSDPHAEVLEVLSRTTNSWYLRKAWSMITSERITEQQLFSSRYPLPTVMRSHSDVVLSRLRAKLPEYVKNPEIITMMGLADDRNDVINFIIEHMKGAFSYRIAQKYLDVSDVSIIEGLIAKLESSGVIMRLLEFDRGLVDTLSHLHATNLNQLLMRKPKTMQVHVRKWLNNHRQECFPEIRFVDPHEPGVFALLKHVSGSAYCTVQRVPYITTTMDIRKSFRQQEVKPKYQKLGVLEQMFPNIVMRNILECARYTVWIESDQGRVDSNLTYIADYILSRMMGGMFRMVHLRNLIPAPTGGELFHRTDNHGFKAGVMLRCYPVRNGSVDVVLKPSFRHITMGIDSNVNVGLIRAMLICARLLLEDRKDPYFGLDLLQMREGCDYLCVDVSELDLCYEMPSYTALEQELMAPSLDAETSSKIVEYMSWKATVPGYEQYRAISSSHTIQPPNTSEISTIVTYVVDVVASEMHLEPEDITLELIEYIVRKHELGSAPLKIFEELTKKRLTTPRNRPSTHSELRADICKVMTGNNPMDCKIPAIITMKRRNVLLTLIYKHCLVFTKCQEHPTCNCLRVNWLLTIRKVRWFRKRQVDEYLESTNKTEVDPELFESFWTSTEGFQEIISFLRSSEKLSGCLDAVLSTVRKGSGKTLTVEVTPPKPPEMNPLIASTSGPIKYSEVEEVCRKTNRLQMTFDTMGTNIPEQHMAFSLTSHLCSELVDNMSDTVIDMCAGTGAMAHGFLTEGCECIAITPDDAWLRRGVYPFVTVDPKYNALDKSTWPEELYAATVLMIDAAELYPPEDQYASHGLPMGVHTIVIRSKWKVVDSFLRVFSDTSNFLKHVYVVTFVDAWRSTYLVFTSKDLGSKGTYSRHITQQERFLFQHPAFGPMTGYDAMTEEEKLLLCRSHLTHEVTQMLRASTIPNALPMTLTQKILDVLVNKVSDTGLLQDFQELMESPHDGIDTDVIRLTRIALSAGFTSMEMLLSYLMTSKTTWTIMATWCYNAYIAGFEDDPGKYVLLRMSVNVREVPDTMKLAALIRRWQKPLMSAIVEILGVIPTRPLVVMKRRVRRSTRAKGGAIKTDSDVDRIVDRHILKDHYDQSIWYIGPADLPVPNSVERIEMDTESLNLLVRMFMNSASSMFGIDIEETKPPEPPDPLEAYREKYAARSTSGGGGIGWMDVMDWDALGDEPITSESVYTELAPTFATLDDQVMELMKAGLTLEEAEDWGF